MSWLSKLLPTSAKEIGKELVVAKVKAKLRAEIIKLYNGRRTLMMDEALHALDEMKL